MKKYLLLVCLLFAGVTFAQSADPEFSKAVTWMYENGLTRYNTSQAFQPDSWVTREQAAKFFVEYNNYKELDTSW
ncbi:MAG: S-layer homology domain-containing protein [Candidatus Peribacteria bacterium]|nr:MAG: S-layer homology domain-containing protein [Candidatus Peribacteria bacterium]